MWRFHGKGTSAKSLKLSAFYSCDSFGLSGTVICSSEQVHIRVCVEAPLCACDGERGSKVMYFLFLFNYKGIRVIRYSLMAWRKSIVPLRC